MNTKRLNRISEEVKKVISELLFNGLKDPRVHPMTSVTEVEVTKDLRYAKIYISVLGNDEDKKNTMEGLESAKGYIRNEIGRKIDLRYVPEPIFYLDESIEHGIYISKLIEDVNKNIEDTGENQNDI
ncbi:MAG TPA: 30S ribosome-binding factor RbfA [Tissierellaceae bacterium]